VLNGSYVGPMLVTVGISFGNNLYNTGSWDFRILVNGAIATGLLALVGLMSPQVATGIAYVALTGELLTGETGPTGKPNGNSPVENLLKITGTNK
jgi:hypothetical protein